MERSTGRIVSPRRDEIKRFNYVHARDSSDIQVEMLERKLDKQMSLKLQSIFGTGDICKRLIGL